jgi:hypothetical protein
MALLCLCLRLFDIHSALGVFKCDEPLASKESDPLIARRAFMPLRDRFRFCIGFLLSRFRIRLENALKLDVMLVWFVGFDSIVQKVCR